jgi:hypothetical protein
MVEPAAVRVEVAPAEPKPTTTKVDLTSAKKEDKTVAVCPCGPDCKCDVCICKGNADSCSAADKLAAKKPTVTIVDFRFLNETPGITLIALR